MNVKMVFAGAAALVLVGAAQAAALVQIQSAAYAATYVRDCRVNRAAGSASPLGCEVTGFTGDSRRVIETQSQMVLGGTTASAQSINPLGQQGGTPTQSNIDVSGAAGQLLLKQGAFSQGISRVSGHSLGLQSFFYNGEGPSNITFQNTLDFTANGLRPNMDLPVAGATNPVAFGKTRVTVFSLNVAALQVDSGRVNTPSLWDVQSGRVADSASPGGFYWGGLGADAANSGYGDFRFEGQVENLGFMASGEVSNLTINMTAGRYYFVETYMGLWARFGGMLDATHTFTTEVGTLDGDTFTQVPVVFAAESQDKQVTAISDNTNTVPEPSALLLAGLGLVLAGRARRRQV